MQTQDTTTEHDTHPIPALYAIGPDAFRAVLALERLAGRDDLTQPLARVLGSWLGGQQGPVADFASNILSADPADFPLTREAFGAMEAALSLGFFCGAPPLDIGPGTTDPLPAVAYAVFRLLGPDTCPHRFERETTIVLGLAMTAEPGDRAEMIADFADSLEAVGGQEVAHA